MYRFLFHEVYQAAAKMRNVVLKLGNATHVSRLPVISACFFFSTLSSFLLRVANDTNMRMLIKGSETSYNF